MNFASLEYLYVFLPIAFCGWLLLLRVSPSAWRLAWLLLCSFAFYVYAGPAMLPLLGGSIAFNFFLGQHLYPDRRRSDMLLGVGIAGNLLLLGYFKYAGFFAENMQWLIGETGSATDVILPLSISFFTFQQIAYLTDRRRGKEMQPTWNLYAITVAFFPHLIAGPIVRHRNIAQQLTSPDRIVNGNELMTGSALIALGLFKKTIVAAAFAGWADAVFSNPAAAHGTDAWFGALSYALQIYFDFSAYSDMAIGGALLFGIRLPVNFFSPYASASVKEFWRTWHMTLGHWLREYLYIPLGGGEKGLLVTARNLMIVMMLAGLWHGAAWGFVVWGALHGAALVLHACWSSAGYRLGIAASRVLTLLFIVVSWVPFRAETMADTMTLWMSMLSFETTDFSLLPLSCVLWSIVGIVVCIAAPNTMQLTGYSTDKPLPAMSFPQAIGVAAVLFIATFPLLLGTETPFIYFGF